MFASKEVKEQFLSNLNGIYALKEEQRATLKAFLCEKEVFTSLRTGFDNTDQHCPPSFALPPLQFFSMGSLHDGYVDKLILCENV